MDNKQLIKNARTLEEVLWQEKELDAVYDYALTEKSYESSIRDFFPPRTKAEAEARRIARQEEQETEGWIKVDYQDERTLGRLEGRLEAIRWVLGQDMDALHSLIEPISGKGKKEVVSVDDGIPVTAAYSHSVNGGELAKRMLASGYRVSEIAGVVGLSKSTVYSLIRKNEDESIDRKRRKSTS